MADPNRKINLDLPSDDDSDSAELELDPSEVSLVKEFEEEFNSRFTEDDKVFAEFCSQKPKCPPLVYPFDVYHHNNRGGGRFQHRQQYDNRNRNYDGNNRFNQPHNNQYHRNDRQSYTRPRYDANHSSGPQ
jgi:mRNA cap methylation, RNMT-activating mini protein